MFSLETCYRIDKRQRTVRRTGTARWRQQGHGSRDERTAAMTGRAIAEEVPGTADQRREQMLRAALAVSSERGYADTRIADVAERTGISPALVIYYSKTKGQLLTEAIRYYGDSWSAGGQGRTAQLPTAAGRLPRAGGTSRL